MILNDCGVVFDKECHTYKLNDKKLSGITYSINDYLDTPFTDIESLPESVQRNIEIAKIYGSNVHDAIEDNYNGLLPNLDFINEVEDFDSILTDLGLKVIASEYIVTDGKRYASGIDNVCVGEDGIYLTDTKTPKQFKSKYCAIQLSIYKRFFELVNPELKVKGAYVIRINRRGKPIKEAKKVKFVSDDIIDAVLYGGEDKLPCKVEELMNNLASVQAEIKRNEEIAKEFKARLLEEFNAYGLDKLDNDLISITRKEAYTRESFDKEAFNKAHPDIDLGNYQKISHVKESILIKLK